MFPQKPLYLYFFWIKKLVEERCFTPSTFCKVKDCGLYYFSDACKKGYGQATYLHVVDESGNFHRSLVMEKAQVAHWST